jgi:hypothetical protein
MKFPESNKMDDALIVHILNEDGQEIEKRVIKKLWDEMSFIEKIFDITGIQERPGTVQSKGKEYAARMFGGDSTFPVNRVGSSLSGGAWTWAVASTIYTATGIITFSNSLAPFVTQGNYIKIGLKNSADTDANAHVLIDSTINTTGTALSWWAEIAVTFA